MGFSEGQSGNAASPGKGMRAEDRIQWMRDDIEFTVEHPGGSRVKLPAATTDIGRGGVGLTTQTFLHVGTRARIKLPTIDGGSMDVRGEVRWCIYDEGLHHCGLRFLEPIRLERVVPRDQWTESMLQDDTQLISGRIIHMFASPLDKHMITLALRDTRISVTAFDVPGAVLDALRSGDVDVLVIDLRNENLDMSQFKEGIDSAGFGGPIVFVADSADDFVAAQCVLGEPKATLKCPLESAVISSRITEVLQEWHKLSGGDDALTTNLRKDDAIVPMLDAYHDACRNAAEAIRAKQAKKDAEGTLILLRRIAGTAGSFGYPVLAKQADAAVRKLESANLEAANTEIAQVRNLLRNLRGFDRGATAA